MRKKDELAVDIILECAKEEFMEKGFEGASMRLRRFPPIGNIGKCTRTWAKKWT